MEYTKDLILHVNYGQDVKNKKRGWNLFYKISSIMSKHKTITAVISITLMLMFLDVILIASFIDVLSSISM